jgi:hypothetical protein
LVFYFEPEPELAPAGTLEEMDNVAGEHTPEPASVESLRRHAADLVGLAARHGVSSLGVAGPGRLVGHLDDDRDSFDVADFETAAELLVGAEVILFSDGVLGKANVSPDLEAAAPL